MTDAEKIRLLQFDREALIDLLVDEIERRNGSGRKDAIIAIESELFDRRRSAGLGEPPVHSIAKSYRPR
jgi:hypothetical protein